MNLYEGVRLESLCQDYSHSRVLDFVSASWIAGRQASMSHERNVSQPFTHFDVNAEFLTPPIKCVHRHLELMFEPETLLEHRKLPLLGEIAV